MTLHRLYRLGEELVANANSRDPFQIAAEIGLQIQMVKDFTVLKGGIDNKTLDSLKRGKNIMRTPPRQITSTGEIEQSFR